MHRILSLTLLAALLATAAAARPPGQPIAEAAPSPQAKTVTLAYSTLLLGTAGPILLGSALISQGGNTNEIMGGWLIAGGIFVGPSAGQFYAESYGSGALSSGLRLGGAALALFGILQSFNDAGEGGGGGAFWALLGTGTFVAGGLHSLIDTKFSVDRHRDRMREESFGLSPTLTPVDGELRPGAVAWMRF